MATHVYIDGFNLYYGAIKGTKFHWLNPLKMCNFLLPKEDIISVRYCTAIVSGREDDPDKPVRQQVYLRALRTVPGMSISLGHFLSHIVSMRLADLPAVGPRSVRVIKTEEKGSDVNLATHLLHDAHLNRYDTAILISNDSDLLEPLRIVRRELGKRVGIVNPQKHPSRVLIQEADFVKQIRPGVLAASQFPDELHDGRGTIRKPTKWL